MHTFLDWDNKTTWRLAMVTVFLAGLAWIALSRPPLDRAAARAGQAPAPQTGFPAPDFSLERLNSEETVSLSDLRGQVLLLNFWATWCPPCRAEMPAIQTVYDRYREQGFTVLAIDLQESDRQVTNFITQMGLTFPVLMDRDGAVFDAYRVRALPSTFFVDRAGIVRQVTVGGPMSQAFIDSEVAALLQERPD